MLKLGRYWNNCLRQNSDFWYANNPLFYKRGFALSLVLKVRIFGTRKWLLTSPLPFFFSFHYFSFFPGRIYEFRKIRNHLVMTTSFRRKWNRPIRLSQCCTQFKSPGVKILCLLYLHYNVAFTFKWYGNSWNKTFYPQRVWIRADTYEKKSLLFLPEVIYRQR